MDRDRNVTASPYVYPSDSVYLLMDLAVPSYNIETQDRVTAVNGGGKKRNHQRHIAGKPRNSKRQRHAVSRFHDRGRRYAQTHDQDMRSQMRAILLEAQPKMVAIESLHPISMMSSARGITIALAKTLPPSENSMRALPSRPSATSENYSVRKPPNLAHQPSPFRRTARPRPARAAGTDTQTTARAKQFSGAGTAVFTPTPIGLPPSSFATGPTSGTANGSLVIHRTC